jgi:2-keto-3-deoxy-L-rhamnonate aldolase RhmA
MIVKNSLKEKLHRKTVSIGSWLQLNNSSAAEILAQSGFEWLTVDMEHSITTLDTAQHMIQVIEQHGVVPLVRVNENNPNTIKQVMDAGAYGVIVPMVNTESDAKKAVNAVKYPPRGTRGVGIARAHSYGRNFDQYVSSINDLSVVIVQIEHIDAVNNLEKIISVEGIDGCFIGPYDLSGSLGMPGKFDHPKVRKALKKVEETCFDNGIPLGVHVVEPDYRQVLDAVTKGYKLVAFSADMLFLNRMCQDQMEKLKGELS